MSDGRIRVVAQTGSTNEDLRAQAAEWPEGQWLRAETQSAGRGRLGRTWQSQTGNLYTSTLVRLRPDDPPITGLSLMVGVAVHDALAGLLPNVPFMLKWPNDVMVNGAKLAGMLLEREGDAVIVGIGVNVGSAPDLPDRPTISLSDTSAQAAVDAAMVLDALVRSFDKFLAIWRAGGITPIIATWLDRAHPLGAALVVSTGNAGPEHGRFGGLDAGGNLILVLEGGATRIVHSGDVGILP